jgi:hypothetical protein
MKELALPSTWCAPHLFPAASTRALISLLVPAAPAITTTSTTCPCTVTEQQEPPCTIGHGIEEELLLQKGEQLPEAPSGREGQLQQLTAVAVAVVILPAVHRLSPTQC